METTAKLMGCRIKAGILEELKLGKGQRFELSDIVGHIGEFSVDQHGSRFIQQEVGTL